MVGSLYRYGHPRPGMPVTIKPANPLPENKKCLGTGDAGKDGYTVISCADRMSGERPAVGDKYPSDY